MAGNVRLDRGARHRRARVVQAPSARWGGEAVAIGGKGRAKDKTPRGPLHGIASHAWSVLAVAVTWCDSHALRPEEVAGIGAT